jgi:hypothetical protein
MCRAVDEWITELRIQEQVCACKMNVKCYVKHFCLTGSFWNMSSSVILRHLLFLQQGCMVSCNEIQQIMLISKIKCAKMCMELSI